MKSSLLFFVVLFSLIVADTAFCKPPSPSSSSGAKSDEKFIDSARAAITEQLKDPESARFRNIFISPNSVAVCGEVNAKNSMGGYVGFKRFIFTREKSGVIDDGTYFVEARWTERCVTGTLDDDNTAH